MSESSQLLDKQRKASASSGNWARKQSRKELDGMPGKMKRGVGMQRLVVCLTSGKSNMPKKSDSST